MDSIAYKQRRQEIVNLRVDEGWRNSEIAQHYGVSRQRIEQILELEGVKHKIPSRGSVARQQAPNLTHLTLNEFAKKMRLSRRYASTIFGKFRHAIEGNPATKKGILGESFVSEILKQHGVGNKLMPPHHLFDILLDNGKTVDVKTAFAPMQPASQSHPYHGFNIRKHMKPSKRVDFFAFVLYDKKEVYFVPYDDVPKSIQNFRITSNPTKYARYKDAFHLLK
jgi:hypothetical protein